MNQHWSSPKFGRNPQTKRTASTTAVVGEFTYVFLNRPNTDFIDWIRFKDPQNPVRGTIDNIIAKHGPIASLVFSDNSIRLYYSGVSEDENFKGKLLVRELKFPAANATDTSNGWIKPATDASAKKSELNFEENVSEGTRLLNALSFLSCSTKNTPNGLIPVVTYRDISKDHYIYAERNNKTNSWTASQLQLEPTKS
ncbi:hypothetical protein AYL99_09928 [Fonsecaea erecta]|uniref:Uncharacterized protein n=1 Tax=Fonsecaea erecta TaxID=1367422 RepID=A0A178Z8J7_9EURO|nr:hypothetical protein AYL99_09928 [Fonsecaea erecta]OAP55776.1 hypothetical protein AYL99_09928 [Fonsecaea erecta]